MTIWLGSHETSPFHCGLVWLSMWLKMNLNNLKNVDCWSAHCYALADGKTFSRIDSTQLTGLCRVYSAEYYFENFALYNITWADPRIVQCLYLLQLCFKIIISSQEMHFQRGNIYSHELKMSFEASSDIGVICDKKDPFLLINKSLMIILQVSIASHFSHLDDLEDVFSDLCKVFKIRCQWTMTRSKKGHSRNES